MVATAIYSVTMVLWKETAFPLCRAIIMGSRGGRQKLILEIIALMVNHPSGILLLYTPAAVYCILQPAIGRGVVNKH